MKEAGLIYLDTCVCMTLCNELFAKKENLTQCSKYFASDVLIFYRSNVLLLRNEMINLILITYRNNTNIQVNQSHLCSIKEYSIFRTTGHPQ